MIPSGHQRNYTTLTGTTTIDLLTVLNREMMQLPMERRREDWTEYYTRLVGLN